MGYSQRLQQNEFDKLRRQEMEAQAILRSLDVVAKRNSINFQEMQRRHTRKEEGHEEVPSLGKRDASEALGTEELKGNEGGDVMDHQKQEELNEVDFAKVETVFKQEIYKRNKQKEIKNELYTSDTFAVNSRNYKMDYYYKKFGVSGSEYQPFVNSIKLYYIEGIIWNYTYYYKGCVSWDWFFPYYYAPLLSDLTNFSRENFEFEMNAPFNPCEQLLSVLPPFSSHALPTCLQPLLHKDDSEIIDLYPLSFFVGTSVKS
jgi:5'-3' exoribonuclease 2